MKGLSHVEKKGSWHTSLDALSEQKKMFLVNYLGGRAITWHIDAPALESALHRAFEDKRINKVNNRKEFYHISLDEIKKTVKESYDKTVDFVDIPEAEQFRTSLLLGKNRRELSIHQ